MIPTVPQKTRGFPMYLSSNTIAPLTVGIPDSFPPDLTPEWTPLKTLEGWKSPGGIVPE